MVHPRLHFMLEAVPSVVGGWIFELPGEVYKL